MVTRRNYFFYSLCIISLFLIIGLTFSLADQPVGQSALAKWSYFEFKSGQFFKYQLKSERGLEGWVSIKVEDGEGDALNITLAGDWMGEFSESAKFEPGTAPMEFVYSVEDFQIPNAMGSLLMVDSEIIENVIWKDGFTWSQDDKSVKVSGTQEYAGIQGLLMTYTSTHFATKKVQKNIYCVNPDLPLPLYLQCPAANDTWTYTLIEAAGY
ncbi:MAG: hypothetical protein JW755_13915 [Candidatus Aminicenantes bacterium]|nr:hypothetical protein [Candidatus Aminicenantes bacterium]